MSAGLHFHAFDAVVVAGLVATAVAVLRSAARYRRHELVASAAGGSVLALALLSPLDTLAAGRFWIHMLQHELLVLVAAPLWVVGEPLRSFARALPRAALRWLGRATPVPATILHAFALWVWHAPAPFQASVASDAVHAAQHLSFFLTALLFWWTVLRRAPGGIAVVCVAATMIHMGLLGALLTFAPAPIYSQYALQDQQLGGLVMWVPAGFVVLVAGLWTFERWLRFPS